ncbi:hypothetical protein Y88_0083 [Novosphingobium nitrogenifigens DSM 19370]|uniref:DUF11 domain-containing protein n=1 Tax=Novosphingobium nitrogenifigens DSM 19370 TaxID=983920 RepID=F1ZBI2_9SPHN|nr:hypothetical protein [Novosphingobium nitrogenifigens]EGD58031.1 hypothetical protein Y88_0083 [Novosphingobium nitrogenifigens DSM 19370]
MKHASKLLGVSTSLVLAMLGSTTAHATGTLAGTTITNTATVNYSVSGIAQNAATASNSVVVDRKVIFTVAGAAATTTVSPGQTSAVTAYTIQNSSNDTLDFALGAVNQSTGATAAHGGTSAYSVTSFSYYIDTNGNGQYDAGTDQQITYLDELAPDTTKTVFVLANVPLSATNAQVSGVVLTATAEQGGGSGSQGTVLTNSTGAWTPGTVQTVFADLTGATDSQYDGKYSAKGDYTVYAPVLTVTKLSSVVSDPINGTTNPKAIPGAVVEYCIVVQNASGAASTTALSISDPLPTQVTYLSSFGILLNGTYSGTACNSDGTANLSNSSYTAASGSNPASVAGTLNNVAAGGATTMRFRATIN